MAEIKLDDLNISMGTYSRLKAMGINHLCELSLYAEEDVFKIVGNGLREVKTAMGVYKVGFKQPEKKLTEIKPET